MNEEIENKSVNQIDYFNFKRVKKHLSELFSYENQLEYLVNIKAEYIQNTSNLPQLVKGMREFDELCDAEITRIKELINITELSGIPRNLEQVAEKFQRRASENIYHIQRPGEKGTKEYFKEIERRKQEAQEEVKKEREQVGRKEKSETNLDEKLKITLTARQWLIAMSFFINAFGLRNIEKSSFGKLLAVLNNGKNLQEFRSKLQARDLITTHTAKDAQAVADLFRKLKLPKIAIDIETAINKTNAKNL